MKALLTYRAEEVGSSSKMLLATDTTPFPSVINVRLIWSVLFTWCSMVLHVLGLYVLVTDCYY